MGSVRATEPSPTIRWSYVTQYGSPSSGVIWTVRSAWLICVTLPCSTSTPLSARRCGATTLRGSIEPAAASGRNGAYVM